MVSNMSKGPKNFPLQSMIDAYKAFCGKKWSQRNPAKYRKLERYINIGRKLDGNINGDLRCKKLKEGKPDKPDKPGELYYGTTLFKFHPYEDWEANLRELIGSILVYLADAKYHPGLILKSFLVRYSEGVVAYAVRFFPGFTKLADLLDDSGSLPEGVNIDCGAAIAQSLWIGDIDPHAGNIGTLPDSIYARRIDFDWAFRKKIVEILNFFALKQAHPHCAHFISSLGLKSFADEAVRLGEMQYHKSSQFCNFLEDIIKYYQMFDSTKRPEKIRKKLLEIQQIFRNNSIELRFIGIMAELNNIVASLTEDSDAETIKHVCCIKLDAFLAMTDEYKERAPHITASALQNSFTLFGCVNIHNETQRKLFYQYIRDIYTHRPDYAEPLIHGFELGVNRAEVLRAIAEQQYLLDQIQHIKAQKQEQNRLLRDLRRTLQGDDTNIESIESCQQRIKDYESTLLVMHAKAELQSIGDIIKMIHPDNMEYITNAVSSRLFIQDARIRELRDYLQCDTELFLRLRDFETSERDFTPIDFDTFARNFQRFARYASDERLKSFARMWVKPERQRAFLRQCDEHFQFNMIDLIVSNMDCSVMTAEMLSCINSIYGHQFIIGSFDDKNLELVGKLIDWTVKFQDKTLARSLVRRPHLIEKHPQKLELYTLVMSDVSYRLLNKMIDRTLSTEDVELAGLLIKHPDLIEEHPQKLELYKLVIERLGNTQPLLIGQIIDRTLDDEDVELAGLLIEYPDLIADHPRKLELYELGIDKVVESSRPLSQSFAAQLMARRTLEAASSEIGSMCL
jgi:hypothetical protein